MKPVDTETQQTRFTLKDWILAPASVAVPVLLLCWIAYANSRGDASGIAIACGVAIFVLLTFFGATLKGRSNSGKGIRSSGRELPGN